MPTAQPSYATDWLALAQALQPETIALRRAIHQEPELGLELPRTRRKLLDSLAPLGLDVRLSETTSGIVAMLDTGRPGPVVLLRGDMDALPVREANDLPFRSALEGRMHACGHDGHSAMVMSAAKALVQRRDRLSGKILFMFQPGEEGWHGARFMIEEGLLDDPKPDLAYAFHVWPTLAKGKVMGRSGTLLAAHDTFEADIVGRGGHGSMPQDAIDPIPVACEAVLALQSAVTRRFSVADPVVVSVCAINGGTTDNVIPERVELQGTIRSLSLESRERAREIVPRVIENVAAAHGATVDFRLEPGFPPTVCASEAVARGRAVTGRLLGPDAWVEMAHPTMGAEDFSYVLQRVPGAMLLLGIGTSRPLHSNHFILDEDVLAVGVALLCGLVEDAARPAPSGPPLRERNAA
ncbi:MAG: Peptidase amidohydrolase [Alphaproteobacteria bacterium]|nr:Peptidase amidohydrolase [Alphaproteobacteria bacterium]